MAEKVYQIEVPRICLCITDSMWVEKIPNIRLRSKVSCYSRSGRDLMFSQIFYFIIVD